MMQPQRRIKLNRRGLIELVLACAFLSLLTLAVWSWQNNGGHVAALDNRLPATQNGIVAQALRHPAIMLSAVVTEFILLLAFTLALVPPAWWLRADHILGTEPATEATPLRWLGAKMQMARAQAAPTEGEVVVNAAGEPIYYEHPGQTAVAANQFSALPGQPVPGSPTQQAQPGQFVPGQPVPGQPMPGQVQPGQPVSGQPTPGQPVPGQAQAAQPVPGQPVNTAEAPSAQPNTTQPATAVPVPLTDVLNFEETEEEDNPLADLANIKDILSSAFDEDAGVDPELEALSRSLDEVSIMTVRTTARQVAATFAQ
jgi:hypothetical protein